MTISEGIPLFQPSESDERLGIANSQEKWSEYVLENGDVIRVRPVVVDIFKSTTQFDPNGNPMLSLKTQLIVDYQAKKPTPPPTSRRKK
jgi:hypothetical protein